jgi:hypothetical protein
MAAPAVTFSVDMNRLNAAIRRFATVEGPRATEAVIKKLGFDAVWRITTSLNGLYGLPKRIDTGRLRAAWNLALVDATGQRAGSTAGGSAKNPQRSSDGEGRMTRGRRARLVLRNTVEYAPDVEVGTATMRPGRHVASALMVIANEAEAVADAAVKAALKGENPDDLF